MDKGKKINWKNGLLLSAVSYLEKTVKVTPKKRRKMTPKS